MYKNRFNAYQKRKHRKDQCIAKRCSATRLARRNYCAKHMMRRFKRLNPEKYWYNVYAQNMRKMDKQILPFRKWKIKLWKKRRNNEEGD